MPFKSDAQRRWMYATHPKMAKRWQKETPKGKDLPEKVAAAFVDELNKISAAQAFKPSPGPKKPDPFKSFASKAPRPVHVAGVRDASGKGIGIGYSMQSSPKPLKVPAGYEQLLRRAPKF